MSEPRPARYTSTQVAQFLDFIGLPRALHHTPPSLSLLRALHIHMITTCPYENLSMHYSETHVVSLDPQTLYNKIVIGGRGRGGYCMELAILFNLMLRGLGFDVYTTGARTRPRIEGVPGGQYPGWVHIINIVTLPTEAGSHPQKWSVDVAFGGDGPTAPMPLLSGHTQTNLGQQEVRLVRDWIPTQTHRTDASKQWIYQYRNGVEKQWNAYYCFPELEFMPADWEIVNYAVYANPAIHHSWTVLVVSFLRGDNDTEAFVRAKRMLVNGVIKENVGGKTSILAKCKSESERVAALDRYFGIKLTPEEVNGIRGRLGELEAPLA